MKYAAVFLLAFLSYPFIAQSQKTKFKKAWHVNVYLLERVETQGLFYTTTDSSIVILGGVAFADTTEIPIADIYKLEIRKQNSVKRNTLIGAVAGFGVGFLIGWKDYDSSGVSVVDQTGHGLGAGLIGGFIGAFTGHLSSNLVNSYLIQGNRLTYTRVRPQLLRYHLPFSQ